MTRTLLTNEELNDIKVGAVTTVASVMAIIVAVVMGVVIYKLYTSKKGTTTIPGGWKFTWN